MLNPRPTPRAAPDGATLRVPAALLMLLLGTLLLSAMAAATATASEAVLLIAAGDMRGEIKPCGCSPEGQMGGLPRRLTYLDQQLAATPTPVLVDLGNNFPEPSAQGDLKVKLIQDLLRYRMPDALLPGPNELALGVEVLAPELPWLASNDAKGTLFQKLVVLHREGTRIGLFGYLSPEGIYQGSQDDYALRPLSDALLAEWSATIRSEGLELAVLLFRGSDAEAAHIAKAGLFAAVVSGNPFSDELNQVLQRDAGAQTWPQVPTKGQGLVRLPLDASHTDAPPMGEVDWLSDRYADHPVAVEAFAEYDESVKQLFFARLAKMEQAKQHSPYVGNQSCAGCHVAAAAVWEGSRHSGALATLASVGKQYDPECLACHVVGYERGGFLSEDLTAHLANVQCEECHGPARAHLADSSVPPGPPKGVATGHSTPGEATCRTCHVGSHSPNFAFDTYWPKIAHGLDAAAPGAD